MISNIVRSGKQWVWRHEGGSGKWRATTSEIMTVRVSGVRMGFQRPWVMFLAGWRKTGPGTEYT